MIGGVPGYAGSTIHSPENPPLETPTTVVGMSEPSRGVLRDTGHHLFPSGIQHGEIYEAPDQTSTPSK